MKKRFIFILAAALILVGCSTKAPAHEIEVSSINSKFDSKESFILYVGSKNCSVCKEFSPIYTKVANKYADYLFSVEYVSATANQKDALVSLETDHIGKVELTPSIFIVKDGEVVNKHTGALTFSELENLLDSFEIIK